MDIVLHHTSVAFDVHLSEIAGTLLMGGQVILLHPNGNFNIDIFSETISRQQVTFLNIVPSLLTILIEYLHTTNNKTCLKTLRCISFQGEPLMASNVHSIFDFVNEQCHIYNSYGSEEFTGAAIQYKITNDIDDVEFIPIGRPMSNVHIHLLDDYLQPIIPGVQTGEIIIGGSGLFAGYYGREDLTRTILCEFNGEMCYKTGDLGWLNTKTRQLEFRGHRHYQVMLRNQPVELEKIEAILMEIVTNCVVIKVKQNNTNYIVAYVQTTRTIQDLRQHCSAHLPLYMIPSMFIPLDTLPMDQNGKINQKKLPLPNFTFLPLLSNENKLPRTEMEQRVYKIWHQALTTVDSIPSISTSFFLFRDDPESFLKLFRLYSINFKHNLQINTFLKQPTIADHARLLLTNKNLSSISSNRSRSIMIKEAPASYSQTRIWLNERSRLNEDKPLLAIYNMPFLYRLSSNHTLSIKQLRHALQLIINKHQSLHTSLVFDTEKNLLIQQTTNSNDNYNNKLFTFIESIFETDEQLNNIINDERTKSQYFNLTHGLIFRCHVIYYRQISSNNLLSDKDVLIFNFHHALFDFPSLNVFLHDLNQAYITGQLPANSDTDLLYLDYAIIEQQMPMTSASMFWQDTLHDCNIDQPLPLPFDRYRLSADEHRTGRGTSVSFNFGQDLSHHFLTYAFSKNIKLEHLTLAIYYAFLFKLTNGEKDLSIGINTNGRYGDEFKSVIGMFVNTIPLRCQLDPHWSFHQLIDYVCEIAATSIKYSYFPLQRILVQHPNASKPAFLDISFEFQSIGNENIEDKVMIGTSQLHAVPMSLEINEDKMMSQYDFILSVQHDLNINQLSCKINASLDLFNVETIDKISQRFHSMLEQMFNVSDIQMKKSIYELSLILPHERLLMQSMNNTEVSFPSVSCIHHKFIDQVMKYPQKLAIELDEQSLTYCELLYYVQVLSLNLLNTHGVFPGDIVCQCVERSLSMVIGIMAIEMVSGVYCPLSSRDPEHRVNALVQQIESHLVLVHPLTEKRFSYDIVSLNIDFLLINNDMKNDDIDQLSKIKITLNDIAYIIFTSGSTGIPKAVQVRHRNFAECMKSLVYMDTFNNKDTIVQMARCSFDIHVQEVLGALMVGASLVMLQPRGTVDLEYLSTVLGRKQITYMHTVPSLLHSFFTFVEQHNNRESVQYIRSLCSGGESFTVKLLDLIKSIGMHNYCVWNSYGPAETTIDCAVHRVDIMNDTENIPIGAPLYNYRCMVMDDFLQSIVIGKEGELLVGGVGIFAGYLERDDLSAKALIEIDGEIFYRTGDLVQLDNNGFLHYRGRKDHQIKLHGQRIELGEIERCLLNTSISVCVVMKWGDDHLIAYVQRSSMDEKQLREHCQQHLPPHMIPSKFIVLEELPLNANGKIDRKKLPPPNFALVSLSSKENQHMQPNNVLEMEIHSVWCEIFQRTHILTNISFFTIGGHSLLLIKLYHRYKTIFNLDANTISIAQLTEHSTIADHARLIKHSTDSIQRVAESWFLLGVTSDNSTADRSSSLPKIRLYIRRKNINDIPQEVTINIEQLEKIYLSTTIQEIYIMWIMDPQFNGNNQSRQRIAAVIVSQAHEMAVLEELETTSKLKQLHYFQIPWVVLIKKKSLFENIDREILKNQYRTKIMNILLANENIYDETVDTSSNIIEQKNLAESRLLIETDKILDPTLQPSVETNNKANCEDIFLTGSTGFLGTYLLNELLKQTDANIYCLVRSIKSKHTSQSRIFYLYGDLTLPQLGLDNYQYSMLVSKIRSIYHCGAEVNFIKSYTELRPANVLGTIELIKLACLTNCRINYISTLSVLNENHRNGYVQSKQVAECLLEQARERNLIVHILRPGFISWSLSTGDFNKTDWFTLLFLDLIEFGSAPETDRTFDMTPVDQMSRSIVELGESEELVEVTINLPETHTITFKAIWTEICRQRMMKPHYLNMIEWHQKLDRRIKMNSELLPGLQLFSNILTDSFSKDTTITGGMEFDLNLPIFVKALLRK